MHVWWLGINKIEKREWEVQCIDPLTNKHFIHFEKALYQCVFVFIHWSRYIHSGVWKSTALQENVKVLDFNITKLFMRAQVRYLMTDTANIGS